MSSRNAIIGFENEYEAIVDSGYGSCTPDGSAHPKQLCQDPLEGFLGDGDAEEEDEVFVPPRKRKHQQTPDECNEEEAVETVKRFFVGVRVPNPFAPKSLYENFEPPLIREKERTVLKGFLEREGTPDLGDSLSFISYRLDDFSIYYPASRLRKPNEMAVLSELAVRHGEHTLLFDGILTDGKSRHYVEGVMFTTLSVGNYLDTTKHDVEGNIWIQTATGSGFGDVWYELGTPAKEYVAYYQPFVWLANFSKHFVDYLGEHNSVTLLDFKDDFSTWIKRLHSGIPSFENWLAEYGRGDFRQAVAAYRDWLWNQVHGARKSLALAPLWREILHLDIIKPTPGAWEQRTVVTPYVYDCFKHMYGDKLKKVTPPSANTDSEKAWEFVGVHVRKTSRLKRDENGDVVPPETVCVKMGDVVAVAMDDETGWTGGSTTWYAYVHTITRRVSKARETSSLGVIWLYSPADTILSKEKYPYSNELFFSDHCNCGELELDIDDVLYTVPTTFFVQPHESDGELFIRQKYRTGDPAFMTLQKSDLSGCKCHEPPKSAFEEVKEKFSPGDTVLVGAIRFGKDILEPAVLEQYDDATELVQMRVLERRNRLQEARPNELLYTHISAYVKAEYLVRPCHVRFYSETDVIPTPYDRDGTGDCFYISSEINENDEIVPFSANTFPAFVHQGFDPTVNRPKLRGLDLFCGGGNFGRGIEEGGAVEMKWAVDIDVPALHTYRANMNNDCQLYLGSINNYMQDAIKERYSNLIAEPGQVDFISAGSPCQGFSTANGNKDSEKSLRNSSLVASVATSIDIYRPKSALLENVHGMATSRKGPGGKEYNVYSQLLCCIVGMGYQAQQYTMDAWSYGSPQSRTRLFLSLAARGQKLPMRPPRSHEHPAAIRGKGLFRAPNGNRFGEREVSGACPFPFISSSQGFGDLPHLGNNHVGVCIRFPDHRTSRIESPATRMLMEHVPVRRDINNWRKAVECGRMPDSVNIYKNTKNPSKKRSNCRSWGRIEEDGLCRTILTCLTPQCANTGVWVHYDQHRLLTVAEGRRAQNFPDDEVLIGSAVHAFKIVGNSVARSVALAWGFAIREAHLGKEK